jgi:hypothetical protein
LIINEINPKLRLLNKEMSCKRGVKNKRFKAAWNVEYPKKILIRVEDAA